MELAPLSRLAGRSAASPKSIFSSRPELTCRGLQVRVLGVLLLGVGVVNDGVYALAAGALAGRLRGGGAAFERTQKLSGLVYIALGIGRRSPAVARDPDYARAMAKGVVAGVASPQLP